MLGLALLSTLAITDGVAPLVPRSAFFQSPAIAAPQLSPDGTKVAFLAPDERDVVQVVVRTVGASDDVRLTNEPKRGVRSFRWAEDGTAIFFPQDSDGDERAHLYVIDLATKLVRDLTPWPSSKNELLETSAKTPDVILVTTNRRNTHSMDVVRVQWKTGAVETDTLNPGDVGQWLVDGELRVRGARATVSGGATELRVRDAAKAPWRVLIHASIEENVRPFGFTQDGKGLILATTISSDTDRVVEKSLKSGTERLLATNPKSDVIDFAWNRATSSLRAVSFEVNGVREWVTLDWAFGPELALIEPSAPQTVDWLGGDRSDQRWVVATSSDRRATRFLVWDRKTKQALPLGAAFPALDAVTLAPMLPLTITARDGLVLQAFLTKPTGASPSPLVVLVHGGPWWRDRHGFHAQAQWLANRGAAVLQVNFRGSTGAGKRLLNAGNKQWGLAMQDDLSDAVAWAVKEGHADPTRVAIMGTSYGGYAALVGLTKTPELYRCGVDLAGPANLFTLLASVPPWWKALEATFHRRIGNPSDAKDKALLTAASPALSSERLTAPLLVGHGQNDPRVTSREAEQLVAAARQTSRSVVAVVYPDEGHGLVRAPNRLDFAARTEAFLATCLGTQLERADPVAGSSAELR